MKYQLPKIKSFNMKKILLFSLLIISFYKASSQNRKIYFLADTINIAKQNRFLKIETASFFEHHFTFFCRCTPPYKDFTSFYYYIKKGDKIAETVSKKPDYDYLSFKEFMDILAETRGYLSGIYELYITEVLPGNKYRTNKVSQVPYSPPTYDSVSVKENR